MGDVQVEAAAGLVDFCGGPLVQVDLRGSRVKKNCADVVEERTATGCGSSGREHDANGDYPSALVGGPRQQTYYPQGYRSRAGSGWIYMGGSRLQTEVEDGCGGERPRVGWQGNQLNLLTPNIKTLAQPDKSRKEKR